jgi:hypothetical protein
MNTGILSLPEGQYRAAEGISKSSLDWIAPPRTPAHYKAKVSGLIKDEQTPAMRLGQMIHRAILEWDSLDYVVKPEGMNFATKEGKEWKAAQTTAIITADEYQTILGMRDSVNAHPAVKRVLANARTEVSLFANGEDGVLRKARIDALPESGNVIVDIKSCQSADPDLMAKSWRHTATTSKPPTTSTSANCWASTNRSSCSFAWRSCRPTRWRSMRSTKTPSHGVVSSISVTLH